MISMRSARYRQMRTLLIRTYLWGLVPIACMVFYMEDGALLERSRCGVAGFFHLHGVHSNSTRAAVQYPSTELARSCCAPSSEVDVSNSQGKNPVLLYSIFGAACSDGRREESDCRSGCVYGMNFGSKRGLSTLSVGAVQLTAYEKWTDPGAPYGSGHYAEICGRISYPLHLETFGVQLATPVALSNTLLINIRAGDGLQVDAANNEAANKNDARHSAP